MSFDLDFISSALQTRPVILGKTPGKTEYAGFSIDSRTVNNQQVFIAIRGERFDGHNFIAECYGKGVRVFITEHTKGIAEKIKDGAVFTVNDTMEALAALAKAYKNEIFASVFALTGSSGKTTSRELIAAILNKKFNVHMAIKNLNNEIGLPLTILDAPADTRIMVLEMGMNHKGEISRLAQICQPLAGAITNIGYAHIGLLGGQEAIADAKSELFQGMKTQGVVFLNQDDPYYDYLAAKATTRIIDFSIKKIQIVKDKILDGYRIDYKGEEFDYPLPGEHNLSNLALALEVAEYYRISPADTVEAIRKFTAVKGRSNILKNGAVTVIDDCYNANPSSMLAALRLLGKCPPRRIAVLSDMLELGRFAHQLHRQTGETAGQENLADLLLCYGEYSRLMAESAQEAGLTAKWLPDKDALLSELKKQVRDGDTVLVKASRGMKLEDAVNILVPGK